VPHAPLLGEERERDDTVKLFAIIAAYGPASVGASSVEAPVLLVPRNCTHSTILSIVIIRTVSATHLLPRCGFTVCTTVMCSIPFINSTTIIYEGSTVWRSEELDGLPPRGKTV
jgi:hypothetical protein